MDKIPIKKTNGTFSIIEGESPQVIPLSRPIEPSVRPALRPPIKPDQIPSAGAKPDFYYSLAEQQEVKAEEEKLKQFGSAGLETDGERVTKELIRANNLTFSDEIYRRRLVALVNARLKDIRDFIETKEMLTRPNKVGGMGYDEVLADKMMGIIEEEATKMHGHPLPKVHEPKVVPPAAPIKPPMPEKIRPPQPRPLSPEPVKPTVAPAPQPIVRRAPEPIRVHPTAPSIPSVIRPAFDTTRPKMEDIRRPPRVLSPVDEIRELSLNDFKRLGESAMARLNKLAEKIDLLQEESYAKKAEGIAAWRQSPVYRLYLEIGQQSMAQNKPVEEIIGQRSQLSQPNISFEEFQLIADFNKSLRF
jgi:hypothetical protein